MVLLRRVIGDALRARRQAQHRTLREVSTAANVSLGYLSEIERGQKEPSSELLSAVCEALGAQLSELLREVSHSVEHAERGTSPAVTVPGVGGPTSRVPDSETVPAGERRYREETPATMAPAARSASAPAARLSAPAPGARKITPVAKAAAAKATVAKSAPAPATARAAAPNRPLVSTTVDGQVAVTVRQDGPLRATLRTTRTHRTDRGRDALAQV
jgi:DNA-binding XRE family transcriptional regulator